MNMRVPNASRNEQPRNEWAARYIERREPIAKRRLLDGWYRWTAPPEPGPNSTLAQREKLRHGRLISLVLLFVLILLVLISPASVSGRNHFLLPVLIGALVICIAALALNRKGYGVIAGIILVVGIDIGFAFSLLNTPGGLGVYNLPTFDLLAFTVLLAVSLLPPWSVFVVMAVNCIFIWADLTFQIRSPELALLMAKTGYSIFVRPLILEVIIAVVTYLWVRGANQAIARADRAEVIASLEHAIIEQKRLLDLGIEQVLQTHVRVSNGDFNARVPLTEESVL
ncbi:MAG: hypothetical protein H0W02_09205, partial [Ktedonobacteraceae bacterium]|nr:hypothetical protein [Ktedonobacteraceae bacterium]